MADELQDFTEEDRPTEPIRFKINDDVFEAAPVLPAGVSHDFALMQTLDPAAQVVLLGHILEAFLLPESALRFATRLRDPEQPITNQQVGKVIAWLVSQYGQRPTMPASLSSTEGDAGATK